MADNGLTHVDEKGNARMVDVTAKPPTMREAVAGGKVRMRPETLALIEDRKIPKGDAWRSFPDMKTQGRSLFPAINRARRRAPLIPLTLPRLPPKFFEVYPEGGLLKWQEIVWPCSRRS